MTVFYYTSTGNSLSVAKSIGGNLISIPQVYHKLQTRYKDNAIGVVFPVYNLSVPEMVQDFLDRAEFESDYIFAVGTYGNMAGPCMYNLQKRALNKGWGFDYTSQILMVDNFLPMFEMSAEEAKLPQKNTEAKIEQLVCDIESRRHQQTPAGLPMRALAAVLSLGGKPNNKKYTVNDSCNSCGTCAKVCPAKNISVSDKVHFSDHCHGCLACAHLCPQNAIHLKNEKSGKRWINPNVSLNEIIKANAR